MAQDFKTIRKNAKEGGANQLELCGFILQNYDVRLRCRMKFDGK